MGLDCSDHSFSENVLGGLWSTNSLQLPHPAKATRLPNLFPANDWAQWGTMAGLSCPIWDLLMVSLCSETSHSSGKNFFRAVFSLASFYPIFLSSVFPFTSVTLHRIWISSHLLLLPRPVSFTGFSPSDSLARLIPSQSLIFRAPELTQ